MAKTNNKTTKKTKTIAITNFNELVNACEKTFTSNNYSFIPQDKKNRVVVKIDKKRVAMIYATGIIKSHINYGIAIGKALMLDNSQMTFNPKLVCSDERFNGKVSLTSELLEKVKGAILNEYNAPIKSAFVNE